MLDLLTRNGLSFTKAAHELGVTPQAVKQKAKRMGIIIAKTIQKVEPSLKRLPPKR